MKYSFVNYSHPFPIAIFIFIENKTLKGKKTACREKKTKKTPQTTKKPQTKKNKQPPKKTKQNQNIKNKQNTKKKSSNYKQASGPDFYLHSALPVLLLTILCSALMLHCIKQYCSLITGFIRNNL